MKTSRIVGLIAAIGGDSACAGLEHRADAAPAARDSAFRLDQPAVAPGALRQRSPRRRLAAFGTIQTRSDDRALRHHDVIPVDRRSAQTPMLPQ